jgi:hypothetical protein
MLTPPVGMVIQASTAGAARARATIEAWRAIYSTPVCHMIIWHLLIVYIVGILANDVPLALKMPSAQNIGIPVDALTLLDVNAVLGEVIPFLLC